MLTAILSVILPAVIGGGALLLSGVWFSINAFLLANECIKEEKGLTKSK
jgi:hypothetical protein